MSFVAEPGWYHEAREAFVPDRNGGGEGFFYLRLLKKLPCSVLGHSTPSTYCGSTPWDRPLCRLPVERRVSARRGWVGENGGLFEHPDGSVREEKPWNG